MRLGPSASYWWALSRLRSIWRAGTEPVSSVLDPPPTGRRAAASPHRGALSRTPTGRVAVSLRYGQGDRVRRPDRPDVDFCFGSTAAVPAPERERQLHPSEPTIRRLDRRFPQCQEPTFTGPLPNRRSRPKAAVHRPG